MRDVGRVSAVREAQRLVRDRGRVRVRVTLREGEGEGEG